MKKTLNHIFIQSLCMVAILNGCTDETSVDGRSANRDNTVNVVVDTVQFSNENTRVEAVGTSRALQSVTLIPVTSGEVIAVNFSSGQRVNTGDVLVELDSRDQVLTLELAKIRLEDTERLFDRYRRTDGAGAVLPTTIDAARTALETARVEYNQAVVALEDRAVKAPFSGYVGISEIEPGGRIGPETIITTLDNRDALLVRFEVPELLVGALQPGDRIAINAWNDTVTAAFGDIVDIDSRIDPVTRTFAVRARVENAADELRPGMSFRVSLEIKGRVYPVIPEIAIQWGTEGSYVWSIVGDQAYRVPARIIQRQLGQVLVDSELDVDSLIVVEGIQRMYEGVRVRYSFRPGREPAALTRDVSLRN